jgi:multicomponent Na+:H+ antiporter subunit E
VSQIIVVLLFALLWPILVGDLSAFNLLVGGALAVLLLSVVRGSSVSFARRLWAFFRYLVAFFYELMVANVVIALLALRPRPVLHPHIIAVPLRLESDAAIALLSATITLLPGTVAMGVSADRKLLYAHAINIADIEEAKRSVSAMETRILGFMS